MGVTILVLVVGLSGLVSLLYIWSKCERHSVIEGYIWGLGVDSYVDYSPKFAITNKKLRIKGWHSNNITIRYAIVKRKWGVIPIYFASCQLKGAYNETNPFDYLFTDVPNGKGYQIEISNFGQMSKGKLFIEN